jgi:hypothetical protein
MIAQERAASFGHMSKVRLLRGLALALSTSATAFFALMVIGYGLGSEGITGEGTAVVGAALLLTAATFGAWMRFRHAGVALLGASAVFATVIALTAGSNVLLVVVLLPAPWYLAGLLVSAHRTVVSASH